MLKLEGQVIIQVLDANTLEVLNTIEQSNVITKRTYERWINSTTTIFNYLHISTDTAPHYEDWITIRNPITNGFIPIGITSPQAFPAVGVIPAYVQVVRRFNAPAVTRDINTVFLSESASTTNIFSTSLASAYVKLTSPCTQTTTQLLDVTYRIRAIVDTSGNTYNHYSPDPLKVLKALFNVGGGSIGGTLPQPAAICPTYNHVPDSSNISPTLSGTMIDLAGSYNSIDNNATSSDVIHTRYGKKTTSWAVSTSQSQGILYGAVNVGPGSRNDNGIVPAYTTTNIDAPNGSKIQPIFSHANSTLTSGVANPFLDGAPSSGTGILNFGGTWAAGNFPELYKIDMINGGAVGTATYKFSKRTHFGLVGSTYRGTAVGLPGLYTIQDHTSPAIATKPHSFWINPASAVNPGNSVGDYAPRLEKYDNKSIITYDQTGVLRYNCVTHVTEIWDNTTTPALNATNIRQVAVNPGDGSMWIACANTGIYKINAAGTIITNFTGANGLPSNLCYALDIGRNNAVWALCDGGVTTSSDDGVSWTNYNAGTVPAFSGSVITGDWSSVHYMRVDPTHVNDRMFFVRYADTALNNSTRGVWWSRGTGVAVNYTGTLDDVARREPIRFNVSDNDGIWASTGPAIATTTYFMTYGSNTVVTSSVSNQNPSIIFVRDAANTQDLLLRHHNISSSNPSSNSWRSPSSLASFFNTITLCNGSGVVVSTVPLISGIIAGVKNADLITNTICGLVHLGGGVLAGYAFSTFGSFATMGGIITNLYGDGTPMGGAHKHLFWEEYGWDGANWVIGAAGAKTTHIGEEPLLHGITAKFTNGAIGISFIAGDYYTGSVNDGILKNNAMTMNMTLNHYVVPTKRLTDFNSVVSLYPYNTGIVTWRKYSASLTINVDNSLTNNIPYRSYALTACSKNRVFGDFSISGTFSANANQQYQIGISKVHLAQTPVINGENEYSTWSFNVAANALAIKDGDNTTVNTPPAISGPTTWNISRVGNTISFSTAGIVRYSVVDTTHSFVVRARFQDIYFGTNAFTINQVTVDSTAVGYYVGLGNSGTNTGIYDNKQMLADVMVSDIFIDGVKLSVLNQDTTNAPPVGGADLCPEEGLLIFNAADVGKTITGSYTMTYNNSTPTGNTF